MMILQVLCCYLVVAMTNGAPLAPGFSNRNIPSGLLQHVKIKMQPRELVDECVHCQPSPTAKDLDVYRLTQLAGGALDDSLVSVKKPVDFHVSSQLTHSSSTQRKRYLKEFVINNTNNMAKFGGRLTAEQELFLVNWLQKQSGCPLTTSWRDMGLFSWPRYVKRAVCVGKPCSLVPTMRCAPSSRRLFPLLRWYCLDARHFQHYPPWVRRNVVLRDGFYCRWIKFNYPITTECSCNCGS